MKKVTLGNTVKEYESGVIYEEIIRENYPQDAEEIILVKINGKLEELSKKLKKDCVLEPVYFKDHPGYNSYRPTIPAIFTTTTQICAVPWTP